MAQYVILLALHAACLSWLAYKRRQPGRSWPASQQLGKIGAMGSSCFPQEAEQSVLGLSHPRSGAAGQAARCAQCAGGRTPGTLNENAYPQAAHRWRQHRRHRGRQSELAAVERGGGASSGAVGYRATARRAKPLGGGMLLQATFRGDPDGSPASGRPGKSARISGADVLPDGRHGRAAALAHAFISRFPRCLPARTSVAWSLCSSSRAAVSGAPCLACYR